QETNDIYDQLRKCSCTKEERTALLENYLESASPQELEQLNVSLILMSFGRSLKSEDEDNLDILFKLAEYNVKVVKMDKDKDWHIMSEAITSQNKQVLETFFKDDWHWENTFSSGILSHMVSKNFPREWFFYILSKIKGKPLAKHLHILARHDDNEIFEAAYEKVRKSGADYNLELMLEDALLAEDLKNLHTILKYEGNKIWQIPFLHGEIKIISLDKLKEIFKQIPEDERKDFINLLNQDKQSLLLKLSASKPAQDKYDKMIFLLDLGADPDTTDTIGDFPLYYAVVYNDEESAKILLSYGANKDRKYVNSSLQLAFAASPKIQAILNKDQKTLIMERIMKDNTQEITNAKEEYKKLWPKNLQVFIVGEAHEQDKYHIEVSKMLTIFHEKYPNNLVLATEFIYTSNQDTVNKYLQQEAIKAALDKPRIIKSVKDGLNKSLKQNDNRIKTATGKISPIVFAGAKNLGIKVVGLENRQDVELYKDAVSLDGLKKRNTNWIKEITKIIGENKNIKILLYCGKAHSDYNGGENSLPKLLDKEGISYKVLHLTGQDEWCDSTAVCNAGFENKKTITKIPKKFVKNFGTDYILNIPKE
ncbi:MAG: ankyrin repeat domain-containing protein, partial [Elusimicrobiota bacterium]|nr:ankyrin repeat domain-containing protein [Elusimicrobiota bacterium]